jgi:hypothetical protein
MGTDNDWQVALLAGGGGGGAGAEAAVTSCDLTAHRPMMGGDRGLVGAGCCF